MKTSASILALLAAFGLAGCDGMSNKATPERLSTLVNDGVDSAAKDQLAAQLDATLARANSIADVNAKLGGSTLQGAAPVALNELLAAALEHNPDIGRAAQGINRADAARMRAIFGYLPQISYSLVQTDVETSVITSDNEVFELGTATYPVESTTLEMRQPLIDVSRIYGIKLTKTARSGAEAQYISTVQRALFDTFDAYLVAAISKTKMDDYKRRSASLLQQAQTESAMAETGLANETSMRTLLSEQAQTESDIALEATRYAEALAQLAYLSGQPIAGVQSVSVPARVQGSEKRITPEAALAAASAQNPELLAVAISVVEADLGRKQAIAADFAPVLDYFIRMETEIREGSRFGGGSETEETTSGVRLTIPIFNARGDGLRTLDANVDLRSAVVDYHSIRRKLETDINMTLQRMAQLSTAIGRLSAAHSGANANSQTERERLASGEASELTVLARERLASEMKLETEVQRLEYLRSWAKLQYLTGAMSADVLR